METAVRDSRDTRRTRERTRSRSRKRKRHSRSSSGERVSRSSDMKTKKKRRHRERSREESEDRLKVRSISELADLVKSGQVQVPRSLHQYQSDRVQLLDQVFTILSPKDVKGMLPDILKDLKMRQVKDLCYEQLRAMSDDQITEAIGNPGSSSSEEQPLRSKGDDAMEKSEEDSSGREYGRPKDEPDIVINISDVSGESEVEERSEVNERSGVVARDTRGRREPGPNERHAPASYNPPTTHSPKRQQAFRRGQHDPPASEQGWTESSQRQAPGHSKGSHSAQHHGGSREKERQSRHHRPPDDGGQAGDDNLLEMDLRRRALEAELRRTNADRASNIRPSAQHEREASRGSVAPIREEESGRGNTECEDVIMVHPECEVDEEEEEMVVQERESEADTGQGSGDMLKVGELLEERLRERALQALLSKKGQAGHPSKRHSTS